MAYIYTYCYEVAMKSPRLLVVIFFTRSIVPFSLLLQMYLIDFQLWNPFDLKEIVVIIRPIKT